MGCCLSCCEDDEQEYPHQHQQQQRRGGSASTAGSRHQQQQGRAHGAATANFTFSHQPPAPPANQCQFCGHSFDISLLDGHRETCRANLRKKASEITANNGQHIALRVFELSSNKDYDDDVICVVCMNALRSYAIVPCGHLIACGLCAKQLDKCPMCRGDRQGLLFVDPMTEQLSTCKHCKNVIHPAYFDGHREVCAMQMRQRLREEEEEAAAAAAHANLNAMTSGAGNSTPANNGGEYSSSSNTTPNAMRPTRRSSGGVSNSPGLILADTAASDAGYPNRTNGEVTNASGELTIIATANGGASSSPKVVGTARSGRDGYDTADMSETDPARPLLNGTPAAATNDASLSSITPAYTNANKQQVSPRETQSPSRNMCIECRKNVIDAALIPCGHACLCAPCGGKATSCPVCHRDVTSVMQVFK